MKLLEKIITLFVLLMILLVISPLDLLPGTDIDDMGYGAVILFWFLSTKLKGRKKLI